MLTITKEFRKAVMDGLKLTGTTNGPGALDTLKVCLFTNNHVPGYGSTFDNLVEPTFAGYAPVTITWGTTKHLGNGRYGVASQVLEFKPTDNLTPVTIIGYGIYKDGTPKKLMMAEQLPIPKAIDTTEDVLRLVVEFALPEDASTSVNVIE